MDQKPNRMISKLVKGTLKKYFFATYLTHKKTNYAKGCPLVFSQFSP